jgi:plastocyanin domain-containing protein
VEHEIEVLHGYSPDRIVVSEGERIRLKFNRQEFASCSKVIVFPTLGIRETLAPVATTIIDVEARTPGEIPFTCGMGMLHGTIVVEPSNAVER